MFQYSRSRPPTHRPSVPKSQNPNVAEKISLQIERFSKDDATSKTTRKWRGNGVATSIYGNMTLFPRHFHVVFDVASCLLNLSNNGLCAPCGKAKKN